MKSIIQQIISKLFVGPDQAAIFLSNKYLNTLVKTLFELYSQLGSIFSGPLFLRYENR